MRLICVPNFLPLGLITCFRWFESHQMPMGSSLTVHCHHRWTLARSATSSKRCTGPSTVAPALIVVGHTIEKRKRRRNEHYRVFSPRIFLCHPEAAMRLNKMFQIPLGKEVMCRICIGARSRAIAMQKATPGAGQWLSGFKLAEDWFSQFEPARTVGRNKRGRE